MGSTWTEDGKRRQAGSLVGWRRHDTCTPDRSGVVSHRPRHHVCPHPVTREPFSSWTASTSLDWAFQEEVASSDLGWTRRKGGNPLGSRREGKGGPPICIKLRTAELRIAQLLEGTRRVLPPVGPAIGSHRGTHPSQHHLPGHLASYRENQPGHRPLDDLPRFEEASARVSPTALQGHPMLKKQAQELGVQLGQDALGLAASPRVNFAFLLPQLPQQFDLPAQAHERHDLSSREHVALDVGQHQQPLQLALFARTHLMALAGSLARVVARSWLGSTSTSLNTLAAWTVFHLALGSFLASSKDLFRQTQSNQAHRHLVPLARSYPHLDHLLTLRQTAQPLRQVPQPSLLISKEHIRFDAGDPEASALAGRSHVRIAEIGGIHDPQRVFRIRLLSCWSFPFPAARILHPQAMQSPPPPFPPPLDAHPTFTGSPPPARAAPTRAQLGGQTDHRAILQEDATSKGLKQRRFHPLPLQELTRRFFQQVPHQLAGSWPKSLFDGLIAYMKAQGGHDMIELRITGRPVVHPAQHAHLHKRGSV